VAARLVQREVGAPYPPPGAAGAVEPLYVYPDVPPHGPHSLRSCPAIRY
jgi:hypothetical protein